VLKIGELWRAAAARRLSFSDGEGELPIDLGQSAMTHLVQAGDRLGPAEELRGGSLTEIFP
jgi:hypothetical protein